MTYEFECVRIRKASLNLEEQNLGILMSESTEQSNVTYKLAAGLINVKTVLRAIADFLSIAFILFL